MSNYQYGVQTTSPNTDKVVTTWHETQEEAEIVSNMVNALVFGEAGETYVVYRDLDEVEVKRVGS